MYQQTTLIISSKSFQRSISLESMQVSPLQMTIFLLVSQSMHSGFHLHDKLTQTKANKEGVQL